MPSVKLSTGIAMYYEEVGQGDPLILLMGTGGSHAFWMRYQAPAFRREFRLILPDNRGTGQTDKPVEQPWTMGLLAQDTVALMDALGIERAHVAGLSLGSAVCQEIALNSPDRVKSISLYNTWGKTDAFLQIIFDHAIYLAQKGEVEELRRYMTWVLFSPQAHEERPDLIEAFLRLYTQGPHPTPGAALIRQLEADNKHDTLDRLSQIQAPTLILAGEQDMNFLPRYPAMVHERIPGSEYHLFTGEGSSHIMCWERAVEFNEVALNFLRAHRG